MIPCSKCKESRHECVYDLEQPGRLTMAEVKELEMKLYV